MTTSLVGIETEVGQRAVTTIVRVAWLGDTLFDHTPQIRLLGHADAHALVDTLEHVQWLVTDEVLGSEAAWLWPPAVGDYPDDDDGLWPWERLRLEQFELGAPPGLPTPNPPTSSPTVSVDN